mmetsp:Transcript_33745/g.41549  ORF Transcript_33745/g.41549 Transcript_33745/m.41549 type:complete len:206 (+) Transcript_33745:204-821(+)
MRAGPSSCSTRWSFANFNSANIRACQSLCCKKSKMKMKKKGSSAFTKRRKRQCRRMRKQMIWLMWMTMKRMTMMAMMAGMAMMTLISPWWTQERTPPKKIPWKVAAEGEEEEEEGEGTEGGLSVEEGVADVADVFSSNWQRWLKTLWSLWKVSLSVLAWQWSLQGLATTTSLRLVPSPLVSDCPQDQCKLSKTSFLSGLHQLFSP